MGFRTRNAYVPGSGIPQVGDDGYRYIDGDNYRPSPAAAPPGPPPRPGYMPVWDMEMSMSPFIDQEIEGLRGQYNTGGMDKFRREALRTGPSAWAMMANQMQDAEESQARGRATADNRGAQAAARTALQMRGGMSGGARERLAKSGARGLMDMQQEIGATADQNRMQIGINDEQNRIAQLGQLPGMEVQALQPFMQMANTRIQGRQFDTEQRMAEGGRRNAWDMDVYKEEGARYGAERQAEAYENANDGSSFICTALREQGLMNRKETARMTKFMLASVLSRADFFAWYLEHGKKAVDLAKQQKYNFAEIKEDFVDDILDAIDTCKFETAQDLYIMRTRQFVKQWTGDAGPKTMVDQNWFRALKALPKMFSHKRVWKWLHSYYVKRPLRKFRLKEAA